MRPLLDPLKYTSPHSLSTEGPNLLILQKGFPLVIHDNGGDAKCRAIAQPRAGKRYSKETAALASGEIALPKTPPITPSTQTR
jgi:hypothetical protein